MKLSDSFSQKNKESTNVKIEQKGDNAKVFNGITKDNYIDCTFNYDSLEPQWKDRLDTYTTTLQQFKPKTALTLLEALENSFITSKQKPSKELCSQISYQKGICNRFLGNKDKMNECFISAYTNNSSIVQFEEQAALSYFRIGDKGKVNDLIDNLLKENAYNPVAWYLKVVNNSIIDFDTTPEFVKQNVLFQQMLYNYFNLKKLNDNISKMEDLSIIPNFKNYKLQDITIYNFDENIFYINVYFADYIRKHIFSFNYFNDGDIEILKVLDKVLQKLIIAIKGSELEREYTSLFFTYEYIQFVLTKDKKHIAEMQTYFSNLKEENEILTLLCANTLQLNDKIDSAIEILDKSNLNQPNIFFLKAHCFIKKNNYLQYAKSIKKWINSIDTVNNVFIEEYLRTLFNIKLFGENDEIKLSDFIQNTKFENEDYKLLTETMVNVLSIDEINEHTLSILKDLASRIQRPNLLLYIASTYYYCKEYELAIEIYVNKVDKGTENLHLLNYIYCLNASNKNTDELLDLLEKWRLNYSFQPILYNIEADLCSLLHNWKRCLEVCNLYLKKDPENDVFATVKLRCLDLLNEDWCESEIKLLSQFFSKCSISVIKNIPYIANTLINHGYYQEGLEILYKNKDKIEVRSSYIFATLTYSQNNKDKEFLKEYDTIIDGCWVKYEINFEIHFYEMSNKLDILYQELLGHKAGDVISIDEQMVNKDTSIRILRIMDKYLYLHDEILEEAKQPQIISGLPLRSFSFSSKEPQSMMQELISLFGKDGEDAKMRRETALNKYYNRTLSFSEIIIQIYKNDYLGGFTNLVYEQNGIVILPLSMYQPLQQPLKDTKFVIDFSSLIILHKIAKEYADVTFPNKFLISTYIVDMIKQKLKTVKEEVKSELVVDFSKNGATKYQIPANIQQNNIAYLEELLKWINANCESIVSPRVVEFKRNISFKDVEEENFIDYILNTILIKEDRKALLLTDDSVYAKFNMEPLQFSISSEKYVKTVLGEEHPAQYEFIKNKYKGITLTLKQLSDEFTKKMNSQDNYYNNCLENGMFSPLSCIDLVKTITQSQLVISQQEIEIKNVFINMLKNAPINNDILQTFETLIAVRFIHSEGRSNFVYKCLDDVYQMLGIIK